MPNIIISFFFLIQKPTWYISFEASNQQPKVIVSHKWVSGLMLIFQSVAILLLNKIMLML